MPVAMFSHEHYPHSMDFNLYFSEVAVYLNEYSGENNRLNDSANGYCVVELHFLSLPAKVLSLLKSVL